MAEPSTNAQLADAFLAEDLRLRRAEAAQRREVLALLLLLERALVQAIRAADPTELATQAQRLRAVERLVRGTLDPLIQERYAAIADLLDAAMDRLAQHTATTVQTVVADTTEKEKPVVLPPASMLARRVAGALFPSPARPTDLSTTGAEWWARLGASLAQRLGDQLKVSVTLEESLTQMVARVRGTAAQAQRDGVMARARQDAARLLTTQVTNAVGESRVAVAERNAGRMICLHSSLLDTRTSSICLGRHGLKYTAGPDHEGAWSCMPNHEKKCLRKKRNVDF